MLLQRQQALQVVTWSEQINGRQPSTHPAGNWLVLFHPEQRVQPNDPADPPFHCAQFRRQHAGISRVPTVAQNHKQSITRPQLSAMNLVELTKRSTDAGAARPPRRPLREGLQRVLQPLGAKQARDLDQPCAEQKSPHAPKVFWPRVQNLPKE